MMSMSGGWFFVVASEAISVGKTTIALPGIGSYVALAITRRDLAAVGWAVLAMLVVILLYDQLLFRPIVAWAEKIPLRTNRKRGSSAILVSLRCLRRSFWVRWTIGPLRRGLRRVMRQAHRCCHGLAAVQREVGLSTQTVDWIWYGGLGLLAVYAAWHVYIFVFAELDWLDLLHALGLGALDAAAGRNSYRLGHRDLGADRRLDRAASATAEALQPVAQFLGRVSGELDVSRGRGGHRALPPERGCLVESVDGARTQWYILFNVIAGKHGFSGRSQGGRRKPSGDRLAMVEKGDAAGIFPYYITGAITASGGSWNARIVARWPVRATT